MIRYRFRERRYLFATVAAYCALLLFPGNTSAQGQASLPGYANIDLTVTNPSLVEVHEQYSLTAGSPAFSFFYFSSNCAHLQRLVISVDGSPIPPPVPQIQGGWTYLRFAMLPSVLSSAHAFDVTYAIASCTGASLSSTDLPILMPMLPLQPSSDSKQTLSFKVHDRSHWIRRVALPRMVRGDDGTWIAEVPALPSVVHLELTGAPLPACTGSGPGVQNTGLFFPNFYGLMGVIVVWCIVYGVWAYRYRDPYTDEGGQP